MSSLCRCSFSSSIESVSNLYEQALIAHPGQVTTGNTNVREIACSHYPSFLGNRDCALSQRRFWTSRQA